MSSNISNRFHLTVSIGLALIILIMSYHFLYELPKLNREKTNIELEQKQKELELKEREIKLKEDAGQREQDEIDRKIGQKLDAEAEIKKCRIDM